MKHCKDQFIPPEKKGLFAQWGGTHTGIGKTTLHQNGSGQGNHVSAIFGICELGGIAGRMKSESTVFVALLIKTKGKVGLICSKWGMKLQDDGNRLEPVNLLF